MPELSYKPADGASTVEIADGVRMELPGRGRYEGVEIDGHAYDVAMTLDLADEGVRPVEVSVAAQPGSPPVSGTVLRSVRVWDIAKQLIERSVEVDVDLPPARLLWTFMRSDLPSGEDREEVSAFVNALRGRRPSSSAQEDLGKIYTLLLALGDQPVHKISETTGVPRTTVHNWLRRAKSEAFLDVTTSSAGSDVE